MDRHKQVEATMRKFAATVLALALATTHGLLDEGGPFVQKDAPKGLRGDAQADSWTVSTASTTTSSTWT